ncbi:unnamed protein product [Effrenium voratum]|nr:unnamed protein product [Effrenium voratum]
MGATASVEAPAAEELKRLFDKHDVTGSGNLERQEAYALIEDLRLRYGMEEELPDSFKDAVFEDFDKDHAGTWSWHDVRVLSGDGWQAMRRRLQRVRVRGGQRHNRAKRQKEQTLTESASSAWAKVSGAGAAVAAMKEVEKVKDLEEEIELDFHPMRIENISIGQESWTFAPQIDLRVIRGDPRRGRAAPHEVNEAVFKGPFVAQVVSKVPRGTTQDPTWSDSLHVTFTKAKGLYVHIILSDNRFGVGLGPLTELLLTLGEVLDMLRSPSVRRLQMQPFTVDQTKVIIRPPVVLVAQFGGPRPSFQRFVHVIRAESLPEESFLLEVELLANNGDGCVLVAQRTDSQSGPDPVYHHSLCLDWDDEGDMAVNCKVMRTSLTSSETFAELREKLPQAALEPVGRSERLEMRCLDGTGTNAEVSLHFADVMPEMSLNITISSATGLAPKSEAWTFNPFVEACVFSRDPRLGSLGRAARVVFGQTEILSNCHSDPHWEQPIVLKIVPEPGLFLRLSACSEAALGVTRAWDELAEVVMEMPEVMKLAQGSVERKYTMKRLFEMKRHGDSELFMSFAQVGGNVAAAAFERTAAAHATRTRDGGVASPRAGRPVQGELMASGSPTSKHTAVQLPIAGGYALPPQPSIQGTCSFQEVPDVIAQLYGPPQQPRYLQSAGWPAPPPPPASAKPSPLPPEELSLALSAGAKAGAQVKGNVPMSFFSLPGNPHLAVLDTRSGEVSVAESKKYILQVISEESFQSTPSHSKMERLISYLRKKRRRAKAKLSTFLQDQGFKRHVNSRRRRWMSYTYPLHVAVAQNNAEIASLLLDCGADPDARDSWGRTPRQLAERASPEVSNIESGETEITLTEQPFWMPTSGSALELRAGKAGEKSYTLCAAFQTHGGLHTKCGGLNKSPNIDCRAKWHAAVSLMEELALQAEIEQARRRRDAALASLAALDAEALLLPTRARIRAKPEVPVPLVSAAGLLQRSCLSPQVGRLPCELWPFVFSCIARAAVPEAVLGRLRKQLDATESQGKLVPLPRAGLDRDFQSVLLDLCQILAVALRGRRDFTLDLDEAWGVVQKKGDYFPMEARRASSQDGFGCIMDLDLPPSLSIDNHERPTKGSYGFHDGLHNLLWKGDRTTDKDDLVQPGIIQLELRVGQLYVFPDWVQTITYPFEGPGQRRWIAATVALTEKSLGLKARQRILAKVLRESAWMASEGEEWQPRDPPFPSEALRSQRRWEKKRHSLGGSQPPWPDLWQADDVSLDWLRGFLAKYRTVEMVATRSAGRESSRRTRVIDVLLDDAKSGEDCLQSFISRLEHRLQAESKAHKERAREEPERARHPASSEGDVAAAVARAKRRASDQKRRQAQVREASARAVKEERYGKRDQRLARFEKDMKAKPSGRTAEARSRRRDPLDLEESLDLL